VRQALVSTIFTARYELMNMRAPTLSSRAASGAVPKELAQIVKCEFQLRHRNTPWSTQPGSTL